MEYRNDPAVDLIYKGRLLYPDEANELKTKTKGKFDLSLLDPIESSDLWKNRYPLTLPQSDFPFTEMDEVIYHSPVLSPSGIFRFNVESPGSGKLYTMLLGKSMHSILLAKGLLQKIGYQIPDIKYFSKIILSFSDEIEKKNFISYLENVAFAGAAKNWIIEELEDHKVIIQDLIMMESHHEIYNLAVGVTGEMIQGRRLLSSLVVPLSLVNLNESVNMLRWNAGYINNKEIVLDHDRLEEFQTSWDDARWIARRIESLKREDWEEIVEGSHVPKIVQMILVEKIISRRNSIMKLFQIEAKELQVNANVSSGVDLVKGKLTKEEWPGYASRFSYGDPESPLSDSEFRSWIKSKAISAGLEFALNQINNLPYLGTDINKINNEKFQENIASAITNSINNQTPAEIPLKAWVFPTFRGQLILNRNLVTGTYLGTDNLVQLVDTVGVSVGAGAFVGTMGLPSPVQAYASGEALFLRSYSHLRPVSSIEKSLKYPFKNILVPLVKRDYGKKLFEAGRVTLDPEADEETRSAAVEQALAPFKESMEIGESIIITDSLTTYASARLAVGHNKLFQAGLGLVPGHVIVSRFHVHRKTEHDFQIYKDLGHSGSLGANLNLDTLIPILSFSYKKSKGQARVKFYTLNLHPSNPETVKNISLLRGAIVASSTKEIEDYEDKKPFVIRHYFSESNPSLNLLFWKWQWQNAKTHISVTHPKGETRWFRRFYKGLTKGKNYQDYLIATVNHWVKLIFDFNLGLSGNSNVNPGFSFKGVAETKLLTFDEEVDQEGRMLEPFIRMTRIKNGWSIDRKNANKILEEFKTRYRHDFWDAPVLNDSQRIFLYNISVNMLFYKKGIEHLFGLNETEIKRIYRKHKSFDNLVMNPSEIDDNDTGVSQFLKFLKKFQKYERKENEEKANKYLLKMFSHLEENLTIAGISEIMGGDQNFFMNSRIEGFREGDEDGNRNLVSSSLGEFGSPQIMGPIVALQRNLEMLEGEFFIYWMMTRLI
jgi:hypothetical protein